jgi:hypothetical protein
MKVDIGVELDLRLAGAATDARTGTAVAGEVAVVWATAGI